MKERGTVIWFNNGKGFGFIKREVGGSDLFVHFSGIAGEGYRTLNEGDKVEYEVMTGRKGLQATAVKVL